MTFRKLLVGLIGVPLALLIVLFAVANRQPVTVGFDPFVPEAPAFAVTLPLFALLLICVMIGVLVGGVAAWLRQGKWRKEAKAKRTEVTRLEAETERARREASIARNALPAPRQAA